MSDEKKFTRFVVLCGLLVVLVLSYNLFLGPFLSGAGEYAGRRMHYEQVISKKDLGLHRAMFWKEK